MATLSDDYPGYPAPGPENLAPSKGNGGASRSSSALQDIAGQLAEISKLLAGSQTQATISQRRADVLSATNSRLRRKLGSLANQVGQARQFAYHDELTGLPNRILLVDRLDQAMGQALRQRKRVALVLLNIDGFDGAGDSVGNAIGDRLLHHIALVLKSSLRRNDTVCRYGGAEFVLMLPCVDDIDGVTAVVRKIRARLGGSYYLKGLLVPVTFSAGLALYPGDGGNCVELLNHADLAMHQAKAHSSLLGAPAIPENVT